MKNSFIKIFLINFLVLLISILFIEIIFGYWFSDHGFGPYMREHRLKKNKVVLTYEGNEYNYFYKRNYHGFRGEEIDPSQIEAVIIGGSTTDERYVPSEFTITSNLNSLLKKNGYNFKIINAGIEAQSTIGHIYNFRYWFPKIKNFSPKLFIFYIGINDYGFKKGQNEYWNFGGDGHVKNPESHEVFFDNLKSNSFIYDKLRIIKQKYYSTNKTNRFNLKCDKKSFEQKKGRPYEYVNYKQALKLYDVEKLKTKHKVIISKYLNRIKILNNYVEKKNSKAIFINQVMANGLKIEKLFILNYALIEYCKNSNLNCIDLAAKLEGEYKYWCDSVHTSPLGSRVVAKTVIDDLIRIIKKEKIF